ncbi:MAG: hypothetical protein EAX86_08515 [Candidatus Heimdallarchaeota archaeon]|nr:hypothetical protein [Candidatus Heimdallarchaeota archaeon]
MVLNIAHRGGASLGPENTLACIKNGMNYADMIEFDIQPSKDKYIMVFHDRDTIERITNEKGKLTSLLFEELRSLDAGSWFHYSYHGEKIPTFEEVLILLKPSNLQLNIELKYFDENAPWFEEMVLQQIHSVNLLDRCVITARHIENIQRLQDLEPRGNYALLQKERKSEEYLSLLLDLNLKWCQIRKSALSHSFIAEAHQHGIKIFYFYADDQKSMENAIELGVDGILTNFPDILREIQNRKT